MAGGRIYGGSDMASVLQNQGISPEAIQALMVSTNPPEFHGSRSMLSFKDARVRAPEQSFFLDMEETGVDDYDDCLQQPEKKRRLTTNQVHLLEKSFETENKLEPKRKIQLARDLGLQPRQIAIWFQNRRARWKTKQLEKDYEALKLNYDELKNNHDNLIKEKEKLKTQVQLLKDMLLQRENEKCNTKVSGMQNHAPPNQQFEELDSDSASEEKKPELPNMTCKQEDMCSVDSIVSDTNSPHFTGEDDEEEKACHFAKLEDNTCGFGLPVGEEHELWCWQY